MFQRNGQFLVREVSREVSVNSLSEPQTSVFIRYLKVWFYIALYPVHWTAQSGLHFPPLADLFIPTPFSASLGSILAMQQLRNDYSLTFPPMSIARYSFIQLSRLRRREVKQNAQTSKRYQRGFEPGLSRLRVRQSTTEPPRSTSCRVNSRSWLGKRPFCTSCAAMELAVPGHFPVCNVDLPVSLFSVCHALRLE